MKYNIIYTKRKTIAIYVRPDGSVEVRCSKNTPKTTIDHFIEKNQSWIEETTEEMRNSYEVKNTWAIEVGMPLMFMGKEYSLIEKIGMNAGFDEKSFYIPFHLDSVIAKKLIVKVYKQLAKNVIFHKVGKYSEIMGVIPTNIKINSATARWGSCSRKNSLNFSWLLIMAEESAIDYVVVHELAHIKQHNHSPEFWREVGRILPSYKQEQEKLMQLQKKLACENWKE